VTGFGEVKSCLSLLTDERKWAHLLMEVAHFWMILWMSDS